MLLRVSEPTLLAAGEIPCLEAVPGCLGVGTSIKFPSYSIEYSFAYLTRAFQSYVNLSQELHNANKFHRISPIRVPQVPPGLPDPGAPHLIPRLRSDIRSPISALAMMHC